MRFAQDRQMKAFLVSLDGVPENISAALPDALPPWRREVASRKRRKQAQLASAVGFLLVRYALRLMAPEIDSDHWVLDKNGKPSLGKGAPCFSLSHTDFGVAAVIYENEVGIDLESVRPLRRQLASRFASEDELARALASDDPDSALIRLWTKKEAVAKRNGIGIGQDLRRLDLSHTASIPLTLGGLPHWLSLSPSDEPPEIVLVDIGDLLSAGANPPPPSTCV
jgi:4'-phosphopantetheinyl transferase